LHALRRPTAPLALLTSPAPTNQPFRLSAPVGQRQGPFAGVRWLGALKSCRAKDVAVKKGDDRGWGQGRANNGFCSAKVDCSMSFYTNQLASCKPAPTPSGPLLGQTVKPPAPAPAPAPKPAPVPVPVPVPVPMPVPAPAPAPAHAPAGGGGCDRSRWLANTDLMGGDINSLTAGSPDECCANCVVSAWACDTSGEGL
jgi:hypothetical protein